MLARVIQGTITHTTSKKAKVCKNSTNLGFDQRSCTNLGFDQRSCTNLGFDQRSCTNLGFDQRSCTELLRRDEGICSTSQSLKNLLLARSREVPPLITQPGVPKGRHVPQLFGAIFGHHLARGPEGTGRYVPPYCRLEIH
jgi:hypothetical protein